MLLTLHISAAIWAIITGTIQLTARKGTAQHKFIGHSWMLVMVIVAVSSFGIREFAPIIGPFSVIHLLSLWILICVAASIYFARLGKIQRHKGFAKGAFFGLVGAGIGALAPGRLMNEWLLGLF
ncbi:DUF2306 domain-containing protein [Marinomonas sp. GJ51-6]|uniref:DUF2306 domain-containing protein n=1 Tax=Marinomonas sp. GJ51-6 TaxID=2992802 RepID=UPI0029343054|nr:DUF2306 domain-containing protein [Marinomonas sp. GJ51-6]WOD06255.1 DUF2306 domain-containing protein [Marinomonas sp. GJ51-6]